MQSTIGSSTGKRMFSQMRFTVSPTHFNVRFHDWVVIKLCCLGCFLVFLFSFAMTYDIPTLRSAARPYLQACVFDKHYGPVHKCQQLQIQKTDDPCYENNSCVICKRSQIFIQFYRVTRFCSPIM